MKTTETSPTSALKIFFLMSASSSRRVFLENEGLTKLPQGDDEEWADYLHTELSLNLGDGRGPAAAAWAFGLTTSIPSVNLTPRIIFGNRLWPSRRRQLFSAASASLKIMASAVLFERHPLERTVRWRTVANELSMTLVVRRCFQCSAGKS